MEQSIVKVNTQLLGDDSNAVNEYLKDLVRQKEELQKSIVALNQMWTGDAYEAFVAAVNSDVAALQTVIGKLMQVYHFEQTAKVEYEQCERDISKLMSEISIKEV